ncbi:hypothetical protein ES703_32981 [subsurface metagenome]
MILEIILILISFLLRPDISGFAGALFFIDGMENITIGSMK